MNIQDRHDELVTRLQDPATSNAERPLLAREQKALAVEIFIAEGKVTYVKRRKQRFENTSQRIYVAKEFDMGGNTLSRTLIELKKLRDARISDRLSAGIF